MNKEISEQLVDYGEGSHNITRSRKVKFKGILLAVESNRPKISITSKIQTLGVKCTFSSSNFGIHRLAAKRDTNHISTIAHDCATFYGCLLY